MIENPLTSYLFGTLVSKPKGLRLKFKTLTVNKRVETFNEREHQTATFEPHGLFLARPTPMGVKDPVLLGVLSHPNLQDEEPDIWLEIGYTIETAEVAVEQISYDATTNEGISAKASSNVIPDLLIENRQSTRKIPRLLKCGIEKIISHPPNVEREDQLAAHVGYRCEKLGCRILECRPTSHTFLSFMQILLDAYNSNLPTPLCLSIPWGGQEKPKLAQPQRFDLTWFDRGFRSIGDILFQLYTTVIYAGMFLPPQPTSNDSSQYEKLVKFANSNLHSMSFAVLKVLLEPLWGTGVGCTPQIREAIICVESLIELSKNPRCYISRLDRLESKSGWWPRELSTILSSILSVPTSAQQFFSTIAQRLAEYSDRPRNFQEAQNFLALDLGLETIDDILLKLPEICVVRNTKTNNSSRFYPRIETSPTWSILAIFTIQEIKIAVLAVTKNIPKEVINVTTTHVQIFRDETLSASFLLPPNGLVEADRTQVWMEQFTGRYFVKFQTLGFIKPKELVVIDFAPCVGRTPKPPIFVKRVIKSTIEKHWMLHYNLSCTDQFAALMVSEEVPELGHSEKLYIPIELQIYKFDSLQGLEALPPISSRELFSSLKQGSARDTVYRNPHINSRMRWWKDLRTFYYTNWVLSRQEDESIAVCITCVRVSSGYDSMKCLAFERLLLKPLLAEFYTSDCRPDFQILHTQVKEYLVMDLKDRPETGQWKLPNRIRTRVIFALHRNKLQRVTVNCAFATRFPEHIGSQMKYAGYETSHMSLFHQRRVFCSDKVVCAVQRLDYKPY